MVQNNGQGRPPTLLSASDSEYTDYISFDENGTIHIMKVAKEKIKKKGAGEMETRSRRKSREFATE